MIAARPFVVGIPTVNRDRTLLLSALDSVMRRSLARPSRVFVIDNAEEGAPEIPAAHGLDVVRPVRNVGCAGAWNLALRLAAPLPLVLMNDDCEVAPDTFERLMRADEPTITCAHGFSCFRIDEGIARAVGEFDEGFYPVYFEDTDYRRRLAIAGIPIVEWDSSRWEHKEGRDHYEATGIVHGKDGLHYQGWSGEKLAWFWGCFEANKRRYREKWGGPPGEERFVAPFGVEQAKR